MGKTLRSKKDEAEAGRQYATGDTSWIAQRPLLFVSLLALVIGVLYVAGFAGCRTPSLSSQALCTNQLTQPWATLIAGTLVLLGAILTYLSTEKTRSLTRQELKHTLDEADRVHLRQLESALNDRFVKAVEQLGNVEQQPVKLGGVYSLMALAEDWTAFGNQTGDYSERANKQAQVCVDVLCSYLRSNTHLATPASVSGDSAAPEIELIESEVRSAIIRILLSTRQRSRPTTTPHPLEWVRLNFDGADIRGAALDSIAGEKISLIGADLSRADLSQSTWTMGNLQRTSLRGADLSRADIRGACMEWADFYSAELSHTKVDGTHFHESHLIGADFSGAVGLTQDQIDVAHCWDTTTTWPKGYQPPSLTKPHI